MADDEMLETAIEVFRSECKKVREGLQEIVKNAPYLATEMSPISAKFEAFCHRMEGPLSNNSIYPEGETKGLENLLERISESLKNLSSLDKQNDSLDETIDDISRVLKRVTKSLIHEYNRHIGLQNQENIAQQSIGSTSGSSAKEPDASIENDKQPQKHSSINTLKTTIGRVARATGQLPHRLGLGSSDDKTPKR
jgi:DNA repair exonuclease SbcCD ATPase subunit